MVWVAVISGIILVVCCLALIAMIVLKSLQECRKVGQQFIIAHESTLKTLERIHQSNVDQNSSVLDRFMALDFSLFKAYQSADTAEAGGFTDPDEEDEGSSVTYTPNGAVVKHGASVEERLQAALDEQQLLAEDFGNDFWAREDART